MTAGEDIAKAIDKLSAAVTQAGHQNAQGLGLVAVSLTSVANAIRRVPRLGPDHDDTGDQSHTGDPRSR